MNLLRVAFPSSSSSSTASTACLPISRSQSLQASAFSSFPPSHLFSSSTPPPARSTKALAASSLVSHSRPASSFPLFSRLPSELVEDILSLYLGSSFLISTASGLSLHFNGLITSDSFCQRLLFLLYSSLPSPATPLSSFTDLTLWEDVPSYYSLLRSLHSVGHLLGHWRSAACYLGQLLCFSLDVRAKQLVGMEVGLGGDACNRAVVEIDLLEEEEPRCYYLEYRPVSPVSSTTCIRHPAMLSFQRGDRAAAQGKSSQGVSSSLRSSFSSFFNYSTTAFAQPAETVDAFTPPSVAMSSSHPYSSFSLYCPSLPSSAYLALGMQNLPTPLQRRQQTLFFPNPASTFYRLPPPSSLTVHPPAPYPPSGLYVGQYGPHGPELMHVDYVGSELISTKVIGDANVPAGKVSFRVQLPFTVAVNRKSAAKGEKTRSQRGDGKRRRSRGQHRVDERKEERAAEDCISPSTRTRAEEPTEMKAEQQPASSPASKRAHTDDVTLSTSSSVDGLSAASASASGLGSRESSMMRSEDPAVSTASLDPHSPVSEHHAVDISDDDATLAVVRSHNDEEEAQSDSDNSDSQSVLSTVSSNSQQHSDADADDVADMDTTDDLVARFHHYRRHLPPTMPSLPTLLTHGGVGTIALTGFNNPQSVAVQCFFHSGACFTLDFLGLIGFVPFACECHDGGGGLESAEEREQRRERARRARRSREKEIGRAVKAGECTRNQMRH